jgi:hypothetical protein
MSVNVQAPPIRAPRVSLLSSADIITIPGDQWWTGIELYPLSATDASGLWPVCPGVDSEATKDARNHVGGQRFQPFAVYATDACSTFGSGGINFTDRATDKLKVVESFWIERELDRDSMGDGNPSFKNSSEAITTGPTDALMAFALLDAEVANDLHDGRGMLHLPTVVFSWLTQYGIFRREGNVWLSPLDNIVVPGRGYTGAGPGEDEPDAGSIWMYGHPGTIQIIRSEIMTIPGEGEIERQMQRSINHIVVVAERMVGYIVANGARVDDDANVTGFYAAQVDSSFVPAS